jgi:hypothetical protein
MRYLIAILSWSVMALSLSGCITASPRNNPLKTLMIDECAEQRRSGTGFNSRKSYQLVRHECGQILTLNKEYRMIDDRNFRKTASMTYFNEEEDFDAETWFMITEAMREKYYPDYLEPEQEVIRANVLNEQQAKTITDPSLLREWEPRLLPVSPYLMHYNNLRMAQEIVSDLIYQHREDEFFTKLKVISTILVTESQKKDPYTYRY